MAFLIIGVWGGRLIGKSDLINSTIIQMPDTLETIPQTINLPNTDQRNLLVIGVDHLPTPHPRLEGIWLVMFFQDKPDFTFLPLFPLPKGEKNLETANLINSFSLDKAGRPSDAFLELLKSQVWWSNYLVIDQDSLIALIDLLGGLQAGSLHSNGADVLARVPSTWQDSSIAYTSQVRLMSQLCDQVQTFSFSRKSIEERLIKIEANLETDLNLIKFLDTWFIKNVDRHSIECEFPLISSAVP